MPTDTNPSFSVARKWSLSLNMLLAFGAVVALLAMTNYLAARHFKRWSLSDQAQAQLSPLSLRVLNAVTNPVKVTLYFDKRDALYSLSHNLLKAYRYANPLIELEVVDYVKEPGAAQLVKMKHKLGETDRDLVIFESQGRPKVVYQGELSDIEEVGPGLAGADDVEYCRGEQRFAFEVGPLDLFALAAHQRLDVDVR